jgi:hypothetical protein
MMMKAIIILIYLFFSLLPLASEVKIVYLEEEPENSDQIIYFKKEANSQLDRVESVLYEAEKELIEIAKEKGFDTIEVFVIEMQHGEIPTESQIGKRASVSFFVSLKCKK